MRKLYFRFLVLVFGIGVIYVLNILTTNLIFNPTSKKFLHTDKTTAKEKDDAEQLGLVRNVEIKTHGGSYDKEPIFRQDVEKPSYHQMSESKYIEELAENSKVSESTMKLRIPYKLVHLDLKGAPPKMSYIVNELLPLIHSAGANGLLVEYEDTFPFHGSYLSQLYNGVYTLDEIKWLLREAANLNFEVIPLIQTFGHMEYVLKKKPFQSLRENPRYAQTICPKQNTSWNLITQLIDQVIELHPASNYIHIGCDEAYQVSECPLCKNTDPKTIFVDHVTRISNYIKTKYKKNVIIWDDMLRKYYTNELVSSNLGSTTEVMIWDYTEDVERLIPNYLMDMYTSVFPHIWVASAFKGAFGEKLYNVNINRHALNHLSWLKTLGNYQAKIKNFRGFALTGWSRYDHFAVLCELLPVAVPSLLLNLLILKHRNVRESIKALGVELKCDLVNVELPIGYCQWPGDRLYNQLIELESLQNQITSLIARTDSSGWFTRWNILNNYTNPSRLVQFYNDTTNLKTLLEMSRIKLEEQLSTYYQKSITSQWLSMVLEPLEFKLNIIIKDIQNLSKRTSW
ncbi:unnamed protein product [Allacma fusca]|uniref:Glycoside hydrolase family 20 catalytic domain-containing protein n=1 Tax=Allacma fusca TaxID=39272 RepID=A0A8J2M8H6_9HEXA|nr:unnamed protein product [Allacma fusca]